MVVAELFTRLGFQVDEHELNRGVNRARGVMSEFASFLGKLALGATFLEVGKHVLDVARDMETINTQLHTMTGSTEKTKMLFQGITDYAKQSAFYVKDVSSAVNQLLLGMVPSQNAIGLVKQLGDVSTNSNQLFRLSQVYGRTYSQGFMSGYERKRFLNANFNPVQQYALMEAEQAGLMKKGQEVQPNSELDAWLKQRSGALNQMIKDKEFSIKMVQDALDYATTKGGMFYQHQLAQMKTFSGGLSTAIDALQINAAQALQALFPLFQKLFMAAAKLDFSWLVPIFQKITDSVFFFVHLLGQSDLPKRFEEFKQALLEFLGVLTGGAQKAGILSLVLQGVAKMWAFFDGAILQNITALLKFLAVVLRVIFGIRDFLDWLVHASTVAVIFGIAVDKLAAAFSKVRGWVLSAKNALVGLGSSIFSAITVHVMQAVDWFERLIKRTAWLQAALGMITKLGDWAGGKIGAVASKLPHGVAFADYKGQPSAMDKFIAEQSAKERADQARRDAEAQKSRDQQTGLLGKISDHTGAMAQGFSEQKLLDLALRPNFARHMALAEYE